MCILVLTRGDGTQFDAASIQEEDIIEICVWLGHTHPEGVLWYLASKLVMLFHSMDEMLVAADGVIKAMTLCKKFIKLRTSPPSATHVKVHMVVMDGEPSGTQHPTPDREEGPQLSLVTLTWVGGLYVNCKQTLGTLGMLNYGNSWRISARRSLSVTKHTPGTHHWPLGNPVGHGIPMKMTRRSPFWEGEGGNPEDNLFDPLPQLNLIKMWDIL